MDLPWEDKYAKVLREMAKKKDIKELAQISPEQVEILSDMTFGATGSLKDVGNVTSLLSKEVEALRKAIADRNILSKADPPQGKLIQAESGNLRDIRNSQLDAELAQNKIGFEESRQLYNKLVDDINAVEQSGSRLNPEDMSSFTDRLNQFFDHPYTSKDSYSRSLIEKGIGERLDKIKAPEPLADVIEIMRSKK